MALLLGFTSNFLRSTHASLQGQRNHRQYHLIFKAQSILQQFLGYSLQYLSCFKPPRFSMGFQWLIIHFKLLAPG